MGGLPGPAVHQETVTAERVDGPHVYGELGTQYFLKDALGIAAGLIAMGAYLYFLRDALFPRK